MKLRYLYHFLAVAEELNFTRAAAKVHTEPSPLSRTIRDLESELQVHLFQRHLRHLRLTMAGEVFRSEVRRLLACLDDACAKARAVEQGYLGQLRIGLANPLAQPQLARLLARCREGEPRTRIRILEMTDEGMTNALNFNQIDAYFTVNPESVRELRKEIAWWDRFAVAIPRNHPLIALSQIPLHEIAKFPLLLFHRKTDSGLKPRPLGRCEGWNPGLEGRGFDRSYLGGVQTPSKFVHSDRHECLSLISCYRLQAPRTPAYRKPTKSCGFRIT